MTCAAMAYLPNATLGTRSAHWAGQGEREIPPRRCQTCHCATERPFCLGDFKSPLTAAANCFSAKSGANSSSSAAAWSAQCGRKSLQHTGAGAPPPLFQRMWRADTHLEGDIDPGMLDASPLQAVDLDRCRAGHNARAGGSSTGGAPPLPACPLGQRMATNPGATQPTWPRPACSARPRARSWYLLQSDITTLGSHVTRDRSAYRSPRAVPGGHPRVRARGRPVRRRHSPGPPQIRG